MKRRRSLPFLVAAAAATALLAGCSGGGPAATDSPDASAGGTIDVVASTNVWGSIAQVVGGDHVSVTSVIDDPDKDPHEYEADSRTQLALSEAALVIENGGGYDDFVDTMLASSKSTAPVINAVDVSGKTAADGEELNEHVWYDFPTVAKVADEIATQLGTIDPANASTYTANSADFTTKIEGLESRTAEAASSFTGTGVAITEPVPLYLLEAMGLENKTPAEFSEAVEEGTDVPATVLQETEALFAQHQVKVLVYNEQTSGPSTDAILNAASTNGVTAIGVTETLPDGTDYVDWMSGYIDQISAALSA
ncbi:ABC transporter substrate-binding protein [Pseudoclavibacter chungangensis]|uniref:ABC transporter substrate-binding protein n=1 Tax=Pseudoclavibacter chungangensis TaxID=587635 RepID=A0A7J5C196_9MICO|nr:zinc ABC transporter substrate-binding protein [Pseudoclavibacter chungangensis]KAB1662397.1 ABC transporter substrate-binding protein [Pseudoclavibacter chungangensis]NYJ68421.1 zinc/manganese transport system substrate-binding protein [Pseudoclavibacter chungangensis]